jgi:transcriptional regulator with XRE-family HTH domain
LYLCVINIDALTVYEINWPMKTNKFDLDNIMAITELNSGLEVEQASSLTAKFKWMQKEDETLRELRKHLVSLIEKYEDEYWTDVDKITEEQVEKSDRAEWLIEQHNLFIQKRKEIIRASLKERNLKQKDLAHILGRSVSYLSEQLNGLRQLSYNDLKILNRLFRIPLKELFDIYLEEDMRIRVTKVIKEYPDANLELNKEDLISA